VYFATRVRRWRFARTSWSSLFFTWTAAYKISAINSSRVSRPTNKNLSELVLEIQTAPSRWTFSITHMLIWTFFLIMTNNITSQNIDLSSWITLYKAGNFFDSAMSTCRNMEAAVAQGDFFSPSPVACNCTTCPHLSATSNWLSTRMTRPPPLFPPPPPPQLALLFGYLQIYFDSFERWTAGSPSPSRRASRYSSLRLRDVSKSPRQHEPV